MYKFQKVKKLINNLYDNSKIINFFFCQIHQIIASKNLLKFNIR